MLYAIPDMKRIDNVPHNAEYLSWITGLIQVDSQAYDRICGELNSRFDDREVDTSSWIPGSDWTETPFDPIYWAAGQDETAAGLFFGLLVWDVVMKRGDCWSFGRYEKDGMPIKGMTYFRIDCS